MIWQILNQGCIFLWCTVKLRSAWPLGLLGAEGDRSPPALSLPFFCVSVGFARADSPGTTLASPWGLRGCRWGDSLVAPPALGAGFGKGVLALA